MVARKSHDTKKPISLDEIVAKTQDYIVEFGSKLIETSGWNQPDAGLAVIACVVGLLSNASEITDSISDIDALLASAKVIKNAFPEFSIKVRDSL